MPDDETDLFGPTPPARHRGAQRARPAPDEIDDWLIDAAPASDSSADHGAPADLDEMFVVEIGSKDPGKSRRSSRPQEPADVGIWPEDQPAEAPTDDLFAAPTAPRPVPPVEGDIFLTGDPGAETARGPRRNPLGGLRRGAAAAAAAASGAAGAATTGATRARRMRPKASSRPTKQRSAPGTWFSNLALPALPDLSRLRRDPDEPAPPVNLRRRIVAVGAFVIVALIVLTVIGSARRQDTAKPQAAQVAKRPAKLVSAPTPAQQRRRDQQQQMAAAAKRGDYDAAISTARALSDTTSVIKFQTTAASALVSRAGKAANRGDLPLATSRLKRAQDRYGRAPGADAVRRRIKDITKAREARAKKRAAEHRRHVAARRAAARRAAAARRHATPAPRAAPTPTPTPAPSTPKVTPAPAPTPSPAPSPPSGGGSKGGSGGGHKGGGGAGEFF